MHCTSDVGDRVEYVLAEEDDALFIEIDHQLDLFRIRAIVEDVLLIHYRYIPSVCYDVSTSCLCSSNDLYLFSTFLPVPIIP